jgi:hypothetical protein
MLLLLPLLSDVLYLLLSDVFWFLQLWLAA